MSIPAMIIDGILLIGTVILISRAYRKGLLRTVAQAAGYLLSCAAAFVGSRALAEACYQLFFRDRLMSSIEKAIEGTAAEADLSGKLSAVMDTLPGYLQKALAAAGMDTGALSDRISQGAADSAKVLSASITETVLYPILYVLMQGIAFLLLFAACMVLVRCLIRVLRGVERLPVVGTLNALTGALMGAVEALVVIFVAAVAVRLLLNLTGGFSWLNEEIIAQTRVFRHFYHFDLRTLPVFSN